MSANDAIYLKRGEAISHIAKYRAISPSTFDRMRQDIGFPKPHKLRPTTRTVYWRRDELDRYFLDAPEAA